MGTWGMGSFENDAASDWAYDLVERNSPAFLAETLQQSEVEYLEGPEGESMVAASEVVLALSGAGSRALPEELQDWVGSRSDIAAGSFRNICLAALDRVLGEKSELLDLWTEAGGDDYDAWRSNVESLQQRIREIPESSSAPPAPEFGVTPAPPKKPWWKFW